VVVVHRYQFEGASYVAVIHQNVSLRRVLNDRVAELQQRMANLERAAAFSEWAGFVSHEIKNPLSVILTRAGLIRLGLKTRTQSMENLLDSCEEIENTVEQIIEIVEGMLSMFKAAPAEEELEEFSVEELINEAVAMTRDYVGSIRVEVPQDGVLKHSMIECNRIHVLQIITNLIRNAAHALRSNQNPWIRLEVRSENDEVQFHVSDSGAGLPEELRHAFRRGGKGEISRRRKNGAGVGFKISRTLAEMHGGELYLEESSPHTCFVLKLPRRPVQTRAA
jgi:signal transduction histidine kinase